MNISKPIKKVNYPIRALVTAHIQFQEALDIISASNNSARYVDMLIELRRFNLNCINRYNAMMSRTSITFTKNKNHPFSYLYECDDTEALFNINNNILTLIPLYAEILTDKSVDTFTKQIVAQNQERLLMIKDELLHPIDPIPVS